MGNLGNLCRFWNKAKVWVLATRHKARYMELGMKHGKVHGSFHVPFSLTQGKVHGNFHVPCNDTYGKVHRYFHVPFTTHNAKYMEISVYLLRHIQQGTWQFPCNLQRNTWQRTWKFPCTLQQRIG